MYALTYQLKLQSLNVPALLQYQFVAIYRFYFVFLVVLGDYNIYLTPKAVQSPSLSVEQSFPVEILSLICMVIYFIFRLHSSSRKKKSLRSLF